MLNCLDRLSVSLQYMRSLNNFRAEQPHQHAMYYLRLLMTEVAWTKDELREALDGETLFLISLFLSLLSSLSPSPYSFYLIFHFVLISTFSTVGQTEICIG